MAILSVTATSVLPYDDAALDQGVAGEAITQGQVIYRSNAGQMMKATNATQAQSRVAGIALTASSRYQPVVFQRGGSINPGATVTVGTLYVLGATAGGIAAASDATEFTNDDWPVFLGCGLESDRLALAIKPFDEPVPSA